MSRGPRRGAVGVNRARARTEGRTDRAGDGKEVIYIRRQPQRIAANGVPSPRRRESRYHQREYGARRAKAKGQGTHNEIERARTRVKRIRVLGLEVKHGGWGELGHVNGKAHKLPLRLHHINRICANTPRKYCKCIEGVYWQKQKIFDTPRRYTSDLRYTGIAHPR